MADTFDQYMQAPQAAQQAPADFNQFMGSGQQQPVVAPQQQNQPPSMAQDAASLAIPGAALPAKIGGVANAGAAAVESVGDAYLWATDKLGLTNPDISTQVKSEMNSWLTQNVRSGEPGSPNDMFSQGVQQNPITANIMQYGVEAGLAIGASPTAGGIVGTAANAAGVQAPKAAIMAGNIVTNALEGAGVGGPNPSSQNEGAIIGGLASPLGSLSSVLVSKAVSKINLVANVIKDYISPITSALVKDGSANVAESAVKAEAAATSATMKLNNANYQAIKNIPGTIDGRVIQGEIANMYLKSGGAVENTGGKLDLNMEKSVLDERQFNVLKSIQQDAGNINNMEQAVTLRQDIAKNAPLFSGQGVTSTTMNDFNALKDKVDNLISEKADSFGLTDGYKKANDYYQYYVMPLHNSGATDRLAAVVKNSQREQVIADNIAKAKQSGQPVPPEPPMDPSYAHATKSILPANPSPQQIKGIMSRMDGNGQQIFQNHLVQQIFGDINANPENFNKNVALMKTNQYLNKYDSVLSDQSKQTLQGAQALLAQSGARAKQEASVGNAYLQHSAGHIIGGMIIGGALGGHEGGMGGAGLGAAFGGIAGIAIGPVLAKEVGHFAKGLMDTGSGQALLRTLSKNPQMIQQVIQSMSVGIASHFNDKTQ